MKLTNSAKTKLRKLATFLEKKVKPSWFDLSTFFDRGFERKSCGSTACALGWATQCFPDSLRLVYINESPSVLGTITGETFEKASQSEDGTWHYECDKDNLDISLEEGAKFLEIPNKLAWFLFMPDEYAYFDDNGCPLDIRNGGGGCGALLLVEQLDVYLTSRSDYTGDTDYFYTFKCCECGVETDLPNDVIPQCVRETARPKRIMGDQRD